MAIDLTTLYGSPFLGDYDTPSQSDSPMRISKRRFIDTTIKNLSTSDYAIIRIKAGQTVIGTTIIVQTAEAAADAMDVGYYYDDTTQDADAFDLNQDMNAVGVFKGCQQGTDVVAGHQFLDDGYITITPAAAHTASKFWVEVEIIDTPLGVQLMYPDYDAAD